MTQHKRFDYHIDKFCRNCQEMAAIRESGKIIKHPVADILKDARRAKGMTQQQVADKAKINMRHYQAFEGGHRNLATASYYIAMAVCMALDIDPDYLFNTHVEFLSWQK